jgi:hypothetical protein
MGGIVSHELISQKIMVIRRHAMGMQIENQIFPFYTYQSNYCYVEAISLGNGKLPAAGKERQHIY